MQRRFLNLFDLRKVKPWILIVAFGLNLLLSFLFLTVVAAWLGEMENWAQGVDIMLMLGELLIGGTIGFSATLLAKDHRGPSYGVLGAIGGFVLVIIFTYQSGLLSLLVALTALLGGYNGGMLGERVLISRNKK